MQRGSGREVSWVMGGTIGVSHPCTKSILGPCVKALEGEGSKVMCGGKSCVCTWCFGKCSANDCDGN